MTDFLSGLALRNHPEKSLCQSFALPIFMPVYFKIDALIYSQRLSAANLAPHLRACTFQNLTKPAPRTR
jgi:hypothetical protein